ncbi:MAG: ImmA/IrrE family metallo-endopeptidase [Aureliella sp.]
MAFDLVLFGDKLRRYRQQFAMSLADVSSGTGITVSELSNFESGTLEPTGDQVLVLADFFKCDYKFFISNEKLAPFEQTETLFRAHGDVLSQHDRLAIQEFLYLCECEEYLEVELGRKSRSTFSFTPTGNFYKKHGVDAAHALRQHLGHDFKKVGLNVYSEFRSIGIHVFRRQLENSTISGLFIRHPVAKNCVLVNYSEDVFRQRFTAAHEAGHALLDTGKDVNISFNGKWDQNDLVEIRANAFASEFLMPTDFLKGIPSPRSWDQLKIVEWSKRLRVSTPALSNALLKSKFIGSKQANELRKAKTPREAKEDPELPESLSTHAREGKITMLQRGLSSYYVELCFDAYEQGIISAARAAEMLLTTTRDLEALAGMFKRSLSYEH